MWTRTRRRGRRKRRMRTLHWPRRSSLSVWRHRCRKRHSAIRHHLHCHRSHRAIRHHLHCQRSRCAVRLHLHCQRSRCAVGPHLHCQRSRHTVRPHLHCQRSHCAVRPHLHCQRSHSSFPPHFHFHWSSDQLWQWCQMWMGQRWLLRQLWLPNWRMKLIKMKTHASRKLINSRKLNLRSPICWTKTLQCFLASSHHPQRPLVSMGAAPPVVLAAVFPILSRHLQQPTLLPVCLPQPQQAPLPRADLCVISLVLIPPSFALRSVRPPLCSHRQAQAIQALSLHLRPLTCPQLRSCRRQPKLGLRNQAHPS